jgi:hypothetical protein
MTSGRTGMVSAANTKDRATVQYPGLEISFTLYFLTKIYSDLNNSIRVTPVIEIRNVKY